jgi:hypothetical protein
MAATESWCATVTSPAAPAKPSIVAAHNRPRSEIDSFVTSFIMPQRRNMEEVANVAEESSWIFE